MTGYKYKKPFFSIAIPTYEMNGYGVKFLDFSLNILNKQTFKDFEIIISDHSINNNNIKNLCDKWSNTLTIKYFKNPNNIGNSSSNINNAIKECNGKWIKFLFQDDFLYNDKSLFNLKNHIKKNKNKEWFATSSEHSVDGYNMLNTFTPKWSRNIHLGNNTISSPSVITIKNNKIKNYLFNEDLMWLMDVEYYRRMYDVYGEPCYFYDINVVNRTWENSVSNTLNDEIKNKELNYMQEKYKIEDQHYNINIATKIIELKLKKPLTI